MKAITPNRITRQAGNLSLEFALSITLLWMGVAGTYSIGSALYTYNQLTIAVSNAARFAGRDGITTSASSFQTRVKNVAVYGNPEGTGTALVSGLTPSSIDVEIQSDAAGVPLTITVEVTSFTISSMFWTVSVGNKPFATSVYTGRYQPYA